MWKNSSENDNIAHLLVTMTTDLHDGNNCGICMAENNKPAD